MVGDGVYVLLVYVLAGSSMSLLDPKPLHHNSASHPVYPRLAIKFICF